MRDVSEGDLEGVEPLPREMELAEDPDRPLGIGQGHEQPGLAMDAQVPVSGVKDEKGKKDLKKHKEEDKEKEAASNAVDKNNIEKE